MRHRYLLLLGVSLLNARFPDANARLWLRVLQVYPHDGMPSRRDWNIAEAFYTKEQG